MSKHASRLIKAAKGWSESLKSYTDAPKGMFNRVAVIESGAVKIKSDEIDLEFEIPFDDDLEADEAEIRVYNLTKNTIKNLVVNKSITVTAGYKGDTGVIFSGVISKVITKRQGVDKLTTIRAIDSNDLKEKDLAEITYAKGTKASYILKDLINKTHLPIAAFEPKKDHTYKEKVTVNGGLMENIRKYSNVCGVSTYINKGKVYAQHIKTYVQNISKGNTGYFNANADTGLINSPEEYTEEISGEGDTTETISGYELELLLQHRLTTGSVVKIKSFEVSGEYRVISGSHRFNDSEAITTIKVQ